MSAKFIFIQLLSIVIIIGITVGYDIPTSAKTQSLPRSYSNPTSASTPSPTSSLTPFLAVSRQRFQPTSQQTSSWWEKAFEKHSIIWLLIYSLLGGLITSLFKLLFEVFLPGQLQERLKALEIKRKYTTPILLAAESLRNRLLNIINLIQIVEEKGWLSFTDQPKYYYVSTIYITGRFFAWMEILRRTIVYVDLHTTRETKKFEEYLDAIEEAFSKPNLLLVDSSIVDNSHRNWCYSYELLAIGEKMIYQEKENTEYKVLGFSSFQESFSEAPKFKKWFDPLEFIFKDVKAKEVKYNRIVAAHTILNAFIDDLDPHHSRTKKHEYCWDKFSNEKEKKIIQNKISKIKEESKKIW